MSLPRAKHKFIEELFSKCWTLQEHIQLLSDYKMVEHLNPHDFCQRIVITLGQKDAKEFQEKFMEEVDRYEQQKLMPLLPYPLHHKQEKQFEWRKMRAFTSSFLELEKHDWNEVVESKEATVLETSDASDDLYYFDFTDSTKMEKSVQKSKNSKPKKAKKSHSSRTAQGFFNNYEKAFYQLLQINLTDYFHEQLEEVNHIVKKQIEESDHVSEIYEQYIRDYLFVSAVRGLESNKRIPEDNLLAAKLDYYFHTYLNRRNRQIQYLPTVKESILTKTWNAIYESVESIIAKKTRNLQKRVKKVLLKGIKTIYLTYQLNSLIYANLNDNQMFININHKGSLTLDQFQKGPLKSYATVCIFHQLSHFLVRNYSRTRLGANDTSHNIQSEQFGNKILTMIQEYAGKRPPEHAVRGTILTQPQQAKIQKINQLAKFICESIEKHKALFDSLKRHTKEWKGINMELKLIEQIADKIENIPIKRFKWSIIYDYIDALQKNHKQKPDYHQKIKETQYAFFFSIFCMDNIVVKWLKKLRQDNNLYRKYKEKVANMKIPCFYIGQNALVEQVIGVIKIGKIFSDQFETDPQVKRFINLFKKEDKRPFVRLNADINSFMQKISIKNIRSFQAKISSIQSFVFIMFPHFKMDRLAQIYIMLEKIPEPIQTNRGLAALLQVKDFHKKLMSLAKELEVISISLQLPSMYSEEADGLRQFQSGFIVQKRLFPLLKREIYAKDFHLLKDIQTNSMKIGQTPRNEEKKRLNVSISRCGLPKEELFVDMSSAFRCGLNAKRLWRLGITESSEKKEQDEEQDSDEDEN